MTESGRRSSGQLGQGAPAWAGRTSLGSPALLLSDCMAECAALSLKRTSGAPQLQVPAVLRGTGKPGMASSCKLPS